MVTEAGQQAARDVGAGRPVNADVRPVNALLTDSTTGTADNTVVDVGAAFNQATLNNNFADLTAKINVLLQDLHDRGLMDPS